MTRLTVIPGGRSASQRFEALIEPHYAVLFRAAWRWTRSVHDAEDLVQETCVRAYPRLAEIEQLEQPRAWLLRVMYRLFVDMSRRYERRHVSSLDAADAVPPPSEDPGPMEQAEQAEGSERLTRAWGHLDNHQRALLSLHDVEGYTLAELMEMTGLKEGTLKSRLHRARVRLGRLLQRDGAVAAVKTEAGG